MVVQRTVPYEDIIPLRESIQEGKINPLSPYPDEEWDHLTIYDQGGNTLARSRGVSQDSTIRMQFQGLNFIATPGYEGNETVSVEWSSILQMANDIDK